MLISPPASSSSSSSPSSSCFTGVEPKCDCLSENPPSSHLPVF